MSESRPVYWFAAKRYGYGWGLPARWEGWVVLIAYAALLYAGIYLFRPKLGDSGLLIFIVALTARNPSRRSVREETQPHTGSSS